LEEEEEEGEEEEEKDPRGRYLNQRIRSREDERNI